MFAQWSNFYVITGSSAAALTGLMFVVVTLIVGRERRIEQPHEGMGAFSTPTVIHFAVAFLISGIVAAPWKSIAPAEILLMLAGVFGIIYTLRATALLRRMTIYQAGADDIFWFEICPLIAYAAIAASAILLFVHVGSALYVLAGATMLLIFMGIRNAWDVVTYLAISEMEGRS